MMFMDLWQNRSPGWRLARAAGKTLNAEQRRTHIITYGQENCMQKFAENTFAIKLIVLHTIFSQEDLYV